MPIDMNRRDLLKSAGLVGLAVSAGALGLPGRAGAAASSIKVLMQTHPATDALRALAPEWTKSTGVAVSIEDFGPEQLLDKLKLSLSAGSADYDVIGLFLDVVAQYQSAGWVEALDPYVGDAVKDPDFVQSFLHGLTYGGETVGLPFYGESTSLTYNKPMFEAAAITAIPKTFDELMTTAKALTDRSKRKYGITLRGQRSGQNLLYIWTGFFQGFGGKYFDADYNPTFASKEGAEAAEYYAELMNTCAPPGAANAAWDVVLSHMQQGLAAMCIDATVFGPQLEDPEKSVVVGKIGYADIPAGPAGPAPSIFTYGLAMPKGSNAKEAAGTFIRWATSSEFQIGSAKEKLRGDVTRSSAWTAMKAMPKYDYDNGNWVDTTLHDMGEGNPDYRPRIPEWPAAADIISVAVSSVIAGQAKAMPALQSAQNQVAKLMKAAGYPKK